MSNDLLDTGYNDGNPMRGWIIGVCAGVVVWAIGVLALIGAWHVYERIFG